MTALDEFERDAVAALEAWLAEKRYRIVADDGHAMIWSDGKPVALDVLNVVNALRLNEQLRKPVPA